MKGLLITVPASLVALTMALMSSEPGGPALALGIAALGSCPHPLALAWAGLGVSLAMGQIVPLPIEIVSVAGMASLGLACAVLTRSISGARGLLANAKPESLLVLCAVIALALLYLPDSRALLETQDGQPLYITAFAQDLSTGVRVQTLFRASADVSMVSPWVTIALAASLGICLFVVLLGSMRGNPEIERLGWTVTVVSGSTFAMLGLAGQLGLVGSAIELKDVFGDWQALAEMSTSGLVLDKVLYPEFGYVGFSSRPAVDLLRVIIGAALVLLALGELRRRVAWESSDDEGRARPELLIAGLLLFAALVFFQYGGGVFYVLSATLLLTIIAGILGNQSSTSKLVPQSLSFGALSLTVLAIVGPTAGWILAG